MSAGGVHAANGRAATSRRTPKEETTMTRNGKSSKDAQFTPKAFGAGRVCDRGTTWSRLEDSALPGAVASKATGCARNTISTKRTQIRGGPWSVRARKNLAGRVSSLSAAVGSFAKRSQMRLAQLRFRQVRSASRRTRFALPTDPFWGINISLLRHPCPWKG
jgi:hypothetical protein